MILAALTGLVTVTFAPLPLPQALERLSAATGQRLVCSTALRDEVIVARLKDADGARVLKEIAACLDARWESQPSRVELVPDPQVRRLRQAAERKARTDAMAKDLAESLKPILEHPGFGRAEADALLKQRAQAEKARAERERKGKGDEEEAGGDEDPTPAARANLRLAKAMGGAALASMRRGERVVFSEDPTPMQREFSGTEVGILGAYRREHALIDPTNPLARVRLVISSEGEGDATLALIAMDAQGNPVDGDFLYLSGSSEAEDAAPANPTSRPPQEKPLDLPKETLEFLAVTARNAKRDALFATWRSKFADPVANEPTHWFPGTVLLALAEAQNRNLVGAVSDQSSRMLRPRGAMTATSLLTALKRDVSIRDGWIIGRPSVIVGRASRADAKGLFAKCVAQGGLDIDSAADWCARYPESYPSISWVGDSLAMLVSRLSISFDADSLTCWGSFSPAQRSTLREGRHLPIAALSGASQELVAEQVYSGAGMGVEGLTKEPTELLPRGILGGRLTMKMEETPVVVSWVEGDEPLITSPVTPELFGQRAARQERSENVVSYAHFRMGTRRTYTLSFDFPGQGSMATQEMAETFFDLQGTPVDHLPDDFAKRAEAAKQKALELPDED